MSNISYRFMGGNVDSSLSPLEPGASSPSTYCIKQRVVRAYIELLFQPKNEHGLRTVIVSESGLIKIEMTEMPLESQRYGAPPFMLEVFAASNHLPVDGCGLFELDDVELANTVEIIENAVREAEGNSPPTLAALNIRAAL